jgi:hypothetical protein
VPSDSTAQLALLKFLSVDRDKLVRTYTKKQFSGGGKVPEFKKESEIITLLEQNSSSIAVIDESKLTAKMTVLLKL